MGPTLAGVSTTLANTGQNSLSGRNWPNSSSPGRFWALFVEIETPKLAMHGPSRPELVKLGPSIVTRNSCASAQHFLGMLGACQRSPGVITPARRSAPEAAHRISIRCPAQGTLRHALRPQHVSKSSGIASKRPPWSLRTKNPRFTAPSQQPTGRTSLIPPRRALTFGGRTND